MGNIAKLAEVNHSLIFHHFKNKAQLWVAVKQDIVARANQGIDNLPDYHLPFEDFLRELFTRNLQFYRRTPDISRMIGWQRLEQNQEPIGIGNSGEMLRWIEAFQHYQVQGEIQADLKPEWIVSLVLSIISSAALDPNVFIHEKKALEGYFDFCREALLRALK